MESRYITSKPYPRALGIQIYVVTHDYEFAANTLTRYLVMENGKISNHGMEELSVNMKEKGVDSK